MSTNQPVGIPFQNPTDYTGPEKNIIPIRRFPRRPLSTDKRYRIGQFAILGKNPTTGVEGELWYLANFDSNGDAMWLQFTSGSTAGVDALLTDDGAPAVGPDIAGIIDVFGGTGITTSGQDPGTAVTINLDGSVVGQTITGDAGGDLSPTAGNWNILGGTVASGTTPIATSGAVSTLTINAQISQALAATDATKIGLSNFNSTHFSVDANGFVALAGSGATLQFDADAGSATPTAGIINILGDAPQGSTTSAAGNTVTITNTSATETQIGVSELATDAEAIAGTDSVRTIVPTSLKAKLGVQTADGIAYGQGDSSAIGWTAGLNDGELAIGSTAGVPAASTLTAGTGVTITNAANSITIDAAAAVPLTFPTDSGTATPAANALSILGGTGISTSGAGSTVTVTLDTPVIVADGGSGRTTATEYAVICGGTTTTNPHQSIASVGTASQVLTSNGAGALPTFQNAGGSGSGAWVWLNTITADDTSDSMIWDNTYINGTYDNYMILADSLVPAANSWFAIHVSDDNASTWITTGYLSTVRTFVGAGLVANNVVINFPLSGYVLQEVGTQELIGWSGQIYLNDLTTTTRVRYSSSGSYASVGDTRVLHLGGGSAPLALDVDAIRLFFDGGNFDTGKAHLYGMRNF